MVKKQLPHSKCRKINNCKFNSQVDGRPTPEGGLNSLDRYIMGVSRCAPLKEFVLCASEPRVASNNQANGRCVFQTQRQPKRGRRDATRVHSFISQNLFQSAAAPPEPPRAALSESQSQLGRKGWPDRTPFLLVLFVQRVRHTGGCECATPHVQGVAVWSNLSMTTKGPAPAVVGS